MYNRCVKNWFKILKHLWKNVRKLQDAGGGDFFDSHCTVFLGESCSSLSSWCSAVFMVKHLSQHVYLRALSVSVWHHFMTASVICQSSTSHHTAVYIGWVCFVDGPSLWLAHRSGLCYLTVWHWLTQLQRHQFTTYLSIYIMLLIYKSTFYLLTSLVIMYSSKTLYEY